MSLHEFEFGSRKHKPTPVGGRDLAAAWLTAAAVVASLLALPGLRGGAHPLPDPALAAAATPRDCLTPDGIGETHQDIETCSARGWADERC